MEIYADPITVNSRKVLAGLKFLETAYTLNHTFQLRSMRDRIQIGHYAAGHMMFLHAESLKKLKSELSLFIPKAAKRRTPE